MFLKKIKFQVRDYFGFTGKEANGFLIIMALMLFLLFVPALVNFLIPNVPVFPHVPDLKKDDIIITYSKTTKKYDGPDSAGRKNFTKPFPRHTEENRLRIIDINTGTSEEFESLKGIGPALAARIIKFRDKLGGFVDISQIGEVYGIDSVVYLSLRSQLKIKSDFIPKKINVNTATEEELISFSYFGKYNGRKIFYSRKKKPIDTIDQLLDLQIIKPEKKDIVVKYLEF